MSIESPEAHIGKEHELQLKHEQGQEHVTVKVIPRSEETPTKMYLDEDDCAKKLRAKASVMQDELGVILTTVKTIKDSCTKLKTENRSLQEYIESLMTQR